MKPDFVKTDFQVLKLKFYICNFKQAFYPFHNYISRDLNNTKILLYKLFVRYLVVKPACGLYFRSDNILSFVVVRMEKELLYYSGLYVFHKLNRTIHILVYTPQYSIKMRPVTNF